MHHDEIWQLYYENGEAIPGAGRDSNLGNPAEDEGEIVVAAAVFLYRRGENGLEVLWQKRSELVNNGGKWDFAAGGHVNVGESVTDAMVREAHEEIGAELSADDLHLVTVRRTYKGMFVWIFLADWTGKPDDFHFDDKEVTEVKWVPWGEMREFWKREGKKPLQKQKETFKLIKKWFEMEGLI